jgi:tetratricopeptide (TPR) repeat protein
MDKLDQAIEQYEKASQARIKPPGANVEARVHVSLGNVYVWKAQVGEPKFFAKAREQFESVTTAYEEGNSGLRDQAAEAYIGLGIVYERTGDWTRAAEAYRKGVHNTRRITVRSRAETQLRIVCGKLRRPFNLIDWLRWCRF